MSPYLHSGDEESSSITSDSDVSSSDSELELTPSEVEEQDFEAHLDLLEVSNANDEASEIETAPIFTNAVRVHTQKVSPPGKAPFGQYGLLAGDVSRGYPASGHDPRIFYNIAAPSSAFICGSQGSGKSHSLSCMLENCLTSSVANVLPRPLTGIVFHYDSFVSDSGGSPCEAAHLSSSSDVKVRVLCPPTNIGNIEVCLHTLQPGIPVRRGLRLAENLQRPQERHGRGASHQRNRPRHLSHARDDGRLLRQGRHATLSQRRHPHPPRPAHSPTTHRSQILLQPLQARTRQGKSHGGAVGTVAAETGYAGEFHGEE